LGDSHRGFRVLGTTPDYFEHYKYRQGRTLRFRGGEPFKDVFDAVLGADVASTLGYTLGDPMVVQHGLGSVAFVAHDDKPFRVAGILEKTGTPVDRTVHVSLEAIEAIHVDWQSGALQRAINEYRAEPLSAILPGAALQELWGLIGTAETALSAISAMVVVTALLGMTTMILTTLNERRREMAILRSVGARPLAIFGLLTAEAGFLTSSGVILGTGFLYLALFVLQPYVDAGYGLHLPIDAPKPGEWLTLFAIVVAGGVAGLLPAARAYRLSVADGMTVRM
jgi:putative ABC transport system permease protein